VLVGHAAGGLAAGPSKRPCGVKKLDRGGESRTGWKD
jgi:hypothetical protein